MVKDGDSDVIGHVVLRNGDYDHPARNQAGKVRFFRSPAKAAPFRGAGDVVCPVTAKVVKRWGWELEDR